MTPEDSKRLADQWASEMKAYEAERLRLLGTRVGGLTGPRVFEFSRNLLAEVLAQHTPDHWLTVAATFERQKPDLNDTDAADRIADVARWLRHDERARACRRHATLVGVDVEAELDDQIEVVLADFWGAIDPTGHGRQRILLHRAADQGAAA
ncbi:hypothetical protein [Nocardioides antri]|uniref:hypothetical protein n=1 Tax=Nocardioides antri TaxID=2607659 RepID=UPI00122C3687|nr:hypothetical protein [Nocardioides antri]